MEKGRPDFSNIPTLNQVKAFMPQLESYSWDKYSPDESVEEYKVRMEKVLNNIIGGLSLLFKPFNGKIEFPFNFYRVRVFDEIKNIRSRSEYSYPPANILSHQRANLPGYPAFYASDHPLTAIIETIRSHHRLPKIKDKYFCLSVWKIKGEQSAILSPLLYDGIPKQNPFYEFGQYQRGKEPAEMKEWFTPEQIEGTEELLKFYSRVFQRDDRYSISSFLAHQHMYNDIYAPPNQPDLQYRADIVIYPSMLMDKKTINYAIHPNFVDERMSLSTVYKIKIDEIYIEDESPNGFKMSFLDYAINHKSRIVWKKPKSLDEIKEKMKIDFPHLDGESGFEPIIKE